MTLKKKCGLKYCEVCQDSCGCTDCTNVHKAALAVKAKCGLVGCQICSGSCDCGYCMEDHKAALAAKAKKAGKKKPKTGKKKPKAAKNGKDGKDGKDGNAKAGAKPRREKGRKRMTKPPNAFDTAILAGPHPGGSSAAGGGTMRNTYAAVVGLYVLDELRLALRASASEALAEQPLFLALAASRGEAEQLALAADGRAELAEFSARLGEFASSYEAQLARTFFDYLTAASIEEMQFGPLHWHGCPGVEKNPLHWQKAVSRFDPRQALPQLAAGFRRAEWKSGYGGEKWAKICDGAALWLSMPPLVFIDHVVDITHNGGLAFNKGYLLNAPSQAAYLAMLDGKRKGSILHGAKGATGAQCGECGRSGSTGEQPISQHVWPWLCEAQALNLVAPTTTFLSAADSFPAALGWGHEHLFLEAISGYGKKTKAEKPAGPAQLETYPEARPR